MLDIYLNTGEVAHAIVTDEPYNGQQGLIQCGKCGEVGQIPAGNDKYISSFIEKWMRTHPCQKGKLIQQNRRELLKMPIEFRNRILEAQALEVAEKYWKD